MFIFAVVIKTQLQVYANIGLWCNGSTTDFGSACPGSNPGTSTFHLTDEFFCPAAVFVQPGFQFLKAGHFLHIPHPFHQADFQRKTIYAFVEIEDIGLDGHRIAVADSRADTDIAHAVELPAHGLDADQVNSPCGNELERLIQLHIGRREAHGASQAVSGHHHSVELVAVSQHCVGLLDLAGGKKIAYLGGAQDNAFRHCVSVGPDDLESESLRYPGSLFRRPEVGTYPVVIAEQYSPAAKTFDYPFSKVFLGRHPAEGPGERDDLDIVDSDSGQDALLNGQVGRVAGFTVFMSNNVKTGTGTDNGHTPYFEITAQVETATTYAEQIIKTEGYRMESRFADGVKGLHVYGAKVTDGSQIAAMYCSVS